MWVFLFLPSGKAGLLKAWRACPLQRRQGRLRPPPPAPALRPRPLGCAQPPAGTLSTQDGVGGGSGPLVRTTHSRCVNIYKTFLWTLQMSKCLLFRLLCQYLLSVSFTGVRQGPCLLEAAGRTHAQCAHPGQVEGRAERLRAPEAQRPGTRAPGTHVLMEQCDFPGVQ